MWQWGGWKRNMLAAGIVAGALAVFVVLYVWWPWWIDGARLRRPGLSTQDQSGILSSDRGDVLKIIAGAGAVVALVYTARKHTLDRKAHDLDLKAQELSRQVFALSEQGQVTDRYTKSIVQLASEKESERIGGIYALERIMWDSERDHPTVVEVLAAFVRQRAALSEALTVGGDPEQVEGTPGPQGQRPTADVAAAMTVLARRPDRDEPFAIDLRHTALTGLELPENANLKHANLQGAVLANAIIEKATLDGANLREATLTRALLMGASLSEAILDEAILTGARLHGASLTRASLFGASLTGAFLHGAKLTEANLKRAKVTGASLSSASLDGARLHGANLTQASLNNASLRGVNLYGASLIGADLSGAWLAGAVLGGANLMRAQQLHAAELAHAVLTDGTVLDEVLANDAWVQERIKACKAWAVGNPAPPPTPNPAVPQIPRA